MFFQATPFYFFWWTTAHKLRCSSFFYFFRNLLELCYMRIKLAPCRYTRVHCANKPGLKGHLPLANLIEFHKWPTGLLLLQQSILGLGPKDSSKQWQKFAKWTSGKMAEISVNSLLVLFDIFCLYWGPFLTVRVHVFMELKLVGQAKPSKKLNV